MLIERLERLEQLDAVRDDWERVYAGDPNADYFRSWVWLRAWLENTGRSWFVLGIRPNQASSYVGFFALAEEVKKAWGVTVSRELHLAGNRISDYTGFLALPEYSIDAIPALADYLYKETEWDRFRLMDVLDPRIGAFLEAFSSRGYQVEDLGELPCPYLDLPGTWESFLNETLVGQTRKNVRRALRKIEELRGFRFTHAEGESLDAHIGILLDMWQARHGKKTDRALETFRHMFRACHAHGSLYLGILWQEKTPIGGALGFVDRVKRCYLGYMNCFNADYAHLSPGTAVLGYTVRYAIENGLNRRDFLRGGEDYKYLYGAKERFNRSYLITASGLKARARRFVSRLAGI